MGLRPLELDIMRNLEKIGDGSREDLNPVNTSVWVSLLGCWETRTLGGRQAVETALRSLKTGISAALGAGLEPVCVIFCQKICFHLAYILTI